MSYSTNKQTNGAENITSAKLWWRQLRTKGGNSKLFQSKFGLDESHTNKW